MKMMNVFKVLFLVQLLGVNAYAFRGQDNFRIEMVKPWGEFGFRVLGKGQDISELHFDCSKADSMGLILKGKNQYGKTSSVVMPLARLGKDKVSCHNLLKKYFAGVSFQRTLASFRDRSGKGSMAINVARGGLFEEKTSNSLILR